MLTPYQQIENHLKNGKITGSWLISGPFGVGKKTFAKKLISFLTTGSWIEIDGYNPNVKWIECARTEEAKKEIQKMILAGKAIEENAKTETRKKEITVDDIREGVKFLSLKASSAEYRILVISLADEMNQNAANALLKMLEEPYPRSIILLIAQNTGKLLPTISSRCRKIIIPRMAFEEELVTLKKMYPEHKNLELLTELSNGSLGMAAKIVENEGLTLYQKLNSFFVPLSKLNFTLLNDFADTVSKNDESFLLFKTFLINWLNSQAKKCLHQKNIIQSEQYVNLYTTTIALFDDINRIYLDKKQAVISTIVQISEVIND